MCDRSDRRSLWIETMNRCANLAVVLWIAAAAAIAQPLQRNFPANALRGELVIVSPPDVTLNGRAARLAPGSRIRGDNNMLLLSGSVVGNKLLVHYTVDTYGLIKDVWILRDDEAAKPWPRSEQEAARWTFDPTAQTWHRR